jgi:hypothetical protein
MSLRRTIHKSDNIKISSLSFEDQTEWIDLPHPRPAAVPLDHEKSQFQLLGRRCFVRRRRHVILQLLVLLCVLGFWWFNLFVRQLPNIYSLNNSQYWVHKMPPSIINNNEHDDDNCTLVVLLGSLRGGPLAWKTLESQVLDLNGADLALMIGEDYDRSSSSSSSLLVNRAKYIWTFPEYNNWDSALDLLFNTAGNQIQKDIPNNNNWRRYVLPYIPNRTGLLGGVDSLKGSGAIIFMARWFLLQQLANNNSQILQKYNRFVITRADHYYKCAHDLSALDSRYLWIPEGEDYGGISDRHLVVSRDFVVPALELLAPLLQNPPPCSHWDFKGNFHWRCLIWHNPERWIHYQWDREGLLPLVRRFPRNMFTCATSSDATRWQRAATTSSQFSQIPEGVMLKYIDEYNASLKTCAKQ